MTGWSEYVSCETLKGSNMNNPGRQPGAMHSDHHVVMLPPQQPLIKIKRLLQLVHRIAKWKIKLRIADERKGGFTGPDQPA
jgi:hypothetical protein